MAYRIDKEMLEGLYEKYNSRKFVHPDPLEFLYRYEDIADREIAGLVASSLAYGRVEQILRSVSYILERMGPSPFEFVMKYSKKGMTAFKGFRHRFTKGEDIGLLLLAVRRIIERYGSINACFVAGLGNNDDTVLNAISAFVDEIVKGSPKEFNFLIPLPERGSACKRLNLFLRWMVRHDDVDLGGWIGVPPSKLLIPLDIHMYRIGLMFGMTKRKQADMKTATEITEAFRDILPQDPVRYDFVLTRFGIRKDMELPLSPPLY